MKEKLDKLEDEKFWEGLPIWKKFVNLTFAVIGIVFVISWVIEILTGFFEFGDSSYQDIDAPRSQLGTPYEY